MIAIVGARVDKNCEREFNASGDWIPITAAEIRETFTGNGPQNWGSLIANELSTPFRLAITTGAMVLSVIGRIA